jgi:hypothetical protein
MRGRLNPDELEVERVASRQSRFQRSRGARTRPAADSSARPLHVVTFGCESFADVTPQALGLTYWFDTAPTASHTG